MPAIEVFLPMPPSTNNLYVNLRGKGRVKSGKYTAWIDEAGRAPLAGAWRRITERQGNGIPWVLFLTVHGLPPTADLTNRIKAVEDLICAMTGLEDRNTWRVEATRRPPHETLGACVMVWASTATPGDE